MMNVFKICKEQFNNILISIPPCIIPELKILSVGSLQPPYVRGQSDWNTKSSLTCSVQKSFASWYFICKHLQTSPDWKVSFNLVFSFNNLLFFFDSEFKESFTLRVIIFNQSCKPLIMCCVVEAFKRFGLVLLPHRLLWTVCFLELPRPLSHPPTLASPLALYLLLTQSWRRRQRWQYDTFPRRAINLSAV